MSNDPIGYGDGLNMYAYVGNDPLNATDPSGLAIAICPAGTVFSHFSGDIMICNEFGGHGGGGGGSEIIFFPPAFSNDLSGLGDGNSSGGVGRGSGSRRTPNPTASANGCGTFGFPGSLVPDTLGGISITEACNNHDINQSDLSLTRRETDLIFLQDMREIMNTNQARLLSLGPLAIFPTLEHPGPWVYFGVVRVFGGNAYLDAQNRSLADALNQPGVVIEMRRMPKN